MKDLATWLRAIGLGRYDQAFADSEIDLEILPHLSDEDLKEIGLPLGPRRKLQQALREAAPQPVPAQFEASAVPDGERRQVTVLFADLSGFTELSNDLDAEETHAILNRYFALVDSIIERYDGTIDKHIGDNVMGVFGAPVAHDDDPERAVRVALAIKAGMADLSEGLDRPLSAHIGIANGQVVASRTGSSAHHEYTVTGDTVNLASRLQERAAPGEILISDNVRRVLSTLAECSFVEKSTVKGFKQPVLLWRIVGLRDKASKEHLGPFVGREAELAQVTSILEICLSKSRGHTLVVRGEPGIGKTRLTDELSRIAADRGFRRHRGLVLDFGIGKGRGAIHSLVRDLIDIPMGSGKAQREAAAEEAIGTGLVDRDRLVFLNDLLDLPQPVDLRSLYDAMDEARRSNGRRTVVSELVSKVSLRQPLLILIEDIHWADEVTLTQLGDLAAAIENCAAVLLMTTRVEGDPLDQHWRSKFRGAALSTIDLGPLRVSEAKEIAESFRGVESSKIVDCIKRAEGHPLFLEQLLRNAEEGADQEVPDTIQSLLQARLDRLPTADKMALQSASVIGQRFTLEALRHLIDDPTYDCETPVRHQLLAVDDGDDFLFAHALIREVAYASLLKARRQDLHLRAAAWFAAEDPILRAEHLARAGDPAAAKAYRKAAETQAASYHYLKALELIERALATSPDASEMSRLICFKGDLLLDGGDAKAAGAAYSQARGIATDDREHCRAEIGNAACLRLVDRFDEAFMALEHAEELARDRGWDLELARLHHLRGNLLFPLGQRDRCQEEHAKALQCAERAHSPELEAQALGGLGDAAYAQGCLITADSYYSRCIDLCQKHGLGRIEVANLPQLGGWGTRFFMGDVTGSLEISLTAVDKAKAVGHERAELIAESGCYTALFSMGESARSRQHVARAKVLIERLGARRFLARALQYEGKIEHWEGRQKNAADRLQGAMSISRETGIRFLGPSILADIAFVTDDPDLSRRSLREGEGLIADGGLGPNDFNFLFGAIDTAIKLEDWDEVDRYCAMLTTASASEPLPLVDFFIARGRGLASWGRAGKGQDVMAELLRLHEQGSGLGLKTSLQAIDDALRPR